MTSTNPSSYSRGLLRLVTGAVFAAAIASANALVYPALSTAEPNNGGGVWDIERYDDCLHNYDPSRAGSEEEMDSMLKWCCDDSGGVWKVRPNGGGECVAPSGTAQGPSWRRALKTVPGDAPLAGVNQAAPLPVAP